MNHLKDRVPIYLKEHLPIRRHSLKDTTRSNAASCRTRRRRNPPPPQFRGMTTLGVQTGVGEDPSSDIVTLWQDERCGRVSRADCKSVLLADDIKTELSVPRIVLANPGYGNSIT